MLTRRSPTLHRRHRHFHLSSATHNAAPSQLTIGIRREDPGRLWERRSPLTPATVRALVDDGIRVLVQPCARRVWTAQEMLEAGAEPHTTLAPADIVLGIKEPPLDEATLAPTVSASGMPRTHLMFSHTHKGQPYNMPLLDRFVHDANTSGCATTMKPRLIDYELLTDDAGRRTVGFGWFAGVAGALESLSALAHALLEIGVATPFLSTPRPHTHPSLPSLLTSLRTLVGDRIAADGTPPELGPIVVGVTGTGQVAQGCLELLANLPTVNVRVEDLPRLVSDPDTDLHKIYVVHAKPQDYFVRADGGQYAREDYYARPDAYTSVFHSAVAPYLTLLLNGAGWAQGFPRLLSNAQLAATLEAAQSVGRGRFACVGDISCDIAGGLEFLPHASTLSEPFFHARAAGLPAHLPSVTTMAVDILPTALAREASEHFSRVLVPYVRALVDERRLGRDRVSGEAAEKLGALERATVASGGKLREKHQWLEQPLGAWREKARREASAPPSPSTSSRMALEKKKRVLVLGSGMVAGPAVDEIASSADVELIVASNVAAEAERLTEGKDNASARVVDMARVEDVAALIEAADVVVSLLPVGLHPTVAALCVKHGKHMVTASYISPEMHALHASAQAADVLLLNEIGLDPGIDHCSALALLGRLHASNKRVVSFSSFCGGLPAPEHASGVPLKYKFSWSPRGVLTAARNDARFKLAGRVHTIPGARLLARPFADLPVSDVLRLEGIPNRDSLPYAETYALGDVSALRTLVRGTLRYPGFSALMHAFKAIGLLDTVTPAHIDAWTNLVRASLEVTLGAPVPADSASLRAAISLLVDPVVLPDALDALHAFGIIPPATDSSTSNLPTVSPPTQPTAPLDLFATVLADKLRYAPGERDIVLLHHEIVAAPAFTPVVSFADSATIGGAEQDEEIHTSSLLVRGTARASAMARTVGLPVAFAVRAVLDGRVSARGVCGPGADRAVWGGVLQGLERVGVGMQVRVRRRGTGGHGRFLEESLRVEA
ncbi:hypothetical protein BDW22DRAFT_1409660 [Trametopsis cervina]|nr:hypothetical protein BDW22DRAFT_1409660 [Trametopsis cervina]